MDSAENYKIVRFDLYCGKCIYKDVEESDPYQKCNDCLAESARMNTSRPLYFKEKE